VGLGPRVRGWAVGFGGSEETHYRRRWRAPHATVRLLRTRRPTPEEHDSWARAPVPEAGPLLSAGMKRHTTAGGGVLLTRRTGPLLSAEVKRRTTAGGGVLLTRRFAFSAHGGRHPRSMTRGPGPSCQRLGHLGTRRARSSVALRGVSWGNLSLKRDSPKRGSHSHHSQRPFALEFSALFCCRSHHGLARSSRALPARGGTQLGAQPARMGCAGVRWKDLCRCLSSRQSHRWRVRVPRLQPPQRVGAADFVFLRVVAGGAWPPTSALRALLHPLGGHHRLPPQDVCGGDAPSRFFLQHSEGRMFTSLVKVDSGLSCGSIPRPQLFGVGSEPCCGSISLALMASMPSAAEDVTRRVVQDVVRRGDGGHVLPARPY
jgi:hypothetical protein